MRAHSLRVVSAVTFSKVSLPSVLMVKQACHPVLTKRTPMMKTNSWFSFDLLQR